MKKYLLTLTICCLFAKTIMAQVDIWYEHFVYYNTPTPPNLNSVCFDNGFNGLACGNNGYIGKWEFGVSDFWLPNPNAITTKNLNSVYIVDSFYISKTYCVGDSGIILKTNNLGSFNTVFYFQNSPTTQSLKSVFFVNYCNGFAVGDTGTVIRTTNGGNQWILIAPITTNSLFSVYFPTTNTGYAVGNNGIVIKTTDNGANWVIKTAPIVDSLRSVWFTAENIGYVVSRNGAIYQTTNGGTSWQSQISTTTENLNAICFISANTGYAAGSNNKVLKTINAGESWFSQTLPNMLHPGHFNSIGFNYSGFVNLVGSQGTAAGNYPESGSIWERLTENNITIFPNPFNETFIVNYATSLKNKEVVFKLYNVYGSLVYETPLNTSLNQFQVVASALKPGVYIASLMVNNVKVCCEKIIKK